MSAGDRIRGQCPACGTPFPEPELEDSYFQHWSTGGGMHDFEIVCDRCGWEFAADHDANITDDGELDDDSPFDAIGADDEDLVTYRCPRCACPVQSEPALTMRCLRCNLDFIPEEQPPIPAEDDCEDWRGCPNCGSDGDIDGEPMTELGDGWILCHRCAFRFHDDEGDWASEAEPATRRRRIDMQPKARAINSLDVLGHELYEVLAAAVSIAPGVYSGELDCEVSRIILQNAVAPGTVHIHGRLRFFGSVVSLRGLVLSDALSFNCCKVHMKDCVIEKGFEAITCDVTMTDCRVVNPDGYGIALCQGSLLRASNCNIDACRDVGLLIETGSLARMRDSRFHANREDAIRVRPSNRLFLHRCEIAANASVGIRVQRGQAVVSNCRITANGNAGLEIDSGSRVFVFRSTMAENVVDVRKRRPILFARRECVIGQCIDE